MTAMRRVVAAVVTAVALVSCSTESGEPRGLAGTPSPPEPTAEPTAAPTSDQTSSAPSPSAEPDPSFTQPWVPGDPSVITLPNALPVENADDLDADEQAVVDGFARAMAAWDGIAFGAPPDLVDLADHVSGELLTSLNRVASDSILEQRVTTGSPTRVVLLSVEVGGRSATVESCFHTPDWVEFVRGAPSEDIDPVERYRITMVEEDATWRASAAEDLGNEDRYCAE